MERVSILTLDDETAWTRHLERLPSKDLTHFPRFSRIYQDKGDGTAECFVYEAEGYTVLYPYIRRPLAGFTFLPAHIAAMHDLIPPYCYGGFIHNAPDDAAPGLLRAFRRRFDEHCRATGVLTEFIRFHPMLQNQRHCEGMLLRLFEHQPNIVMDLSYGDDDLFARCLPKFRRDIRRASEADLEFGRETIGPETPSVFASLYSATMRRHGQNGYLNLPGSYFTSLFRELAGELHLFTVRHRGRLAAAAVILAYNGVLEYFLSASEEELLPLHPNNLLLYRIACWGHAEGYRLFHLGGGRPSLVHFKSGLSDGRVPYYVGHHIHDHGAYEEAGRARLAHKPLRNISPFFPLYREGLD